MRTDGPVELLLGLEEQSPTPIPLLNVMTYSSMVLDTFLG